MYEDRQNGLYEICGGVRTAQRQTPTQSPIGFCSHFIAISVGLNVMQCECTIKAVNSRSLVAWNHKHLCLLPFIKGYQLL